MQLELEDDLVGKERELTLAYSYDVDSYRSGSKRFWHDEVDVSPRNSKRRSLPRSCCVVLGVRRPKPGSLQGSRTSRNFKDRVTPLRRTALSCFPRPAASLCRTPRFSLVDYDRGLR